MKKILIILILLLSCVYAYEIIDIYEYDNFLKTLNLSNRQAQKIENIKQEYGFKIADLNAKILLNDMQIAQLRTNPRNYASISMIQQENSYLKKELKETEKKKEKETLSALNFIQKYKYRKYAKSH